MSRILVAGLAVMDLIFEVDSLPEKAEKYIAGDAQMVGGGGAANAAVAIARLQRKPMLLARLGDDPFGIQIYNELQACGVDCSLIKRTAGGRSSLSSVLVDQSGERQIVNFRGCDLADAVPPVDHLEVDGVLADTRWQSATDTVLGYARERGIPGVLDAEAPVPKASVALASHVAFSAQGIRSYTGLTDIQEALLAVERSVDGFVSVTDGDNGVLYVQNDQVKRVPAYPVCAVDTLGAGDVWHAAFCCRLVSGDSEVQAMQFANAAAAIKCTRKGGGRMSPTMDEVLAFIEEKKR